MTFDRQPVRAIQVRAFCECGGELKVIPQHPMWCPVTPGVPHACERCGHEENLPRVYPCVEYEPHA